MLQLFRVRPPLSTGQRVNLDLLMRRTIDAISTDLPKEVRIVQDIRQLRIDTSTPAETLETTRSAIMERFPSVGSSLDLVISSDEAADFPSLYHRATASSTAKIDVHTDTLNDPLRTVMEFANQYATHFWHSSGLIEPEEVHPNLSHLLPICCGLGVLASDASFYDSQTSSVGWHRWSMSRSGFYNATEIGYASALMARHRGELDAVWLAAMRLDSRDTAKKALRYFDDCDRNQRPILFDADKIPSSSCNPTELAEWFSGNDETFAIAAGYALLKQDSTSDLVCEAAMAVAKGPKRELVPIAIRLLGRSKRSEELRKLIGKLIANKNHVISIMALHSADELGIPMMPYRERIAHLLDVYAEGSDSLVKIVANQGPAFESLTPLICAHLGEAATYSNDKAIALLVECLGQISANPEAAVEREITDPEARERALAVWHDFSSRGK